MARVVSEQGPACCYGADGHLSPEGNRRLAGWLLGRLSPRFDVASIPGRTGTMTTEMRTTLNMPSPPP
jgi:hypothetical protein